MLAVLEVLTLEERVTDDDKDNATAKDAAEFATLLAGKLGVDPKLRMGAHEDIHYYLWRERKLPANVLAEDAKLRDPMERARLAKLFAGAGLSAEAGSVLPLRRALVEGQRLWESGTWSLREGELFLIPGDSPIGFRLPLDSLPWASEKAIDSRPEATCCAA